MSKFSHSWVQFSVIAKIAGTNTNGPITILGAHEDSINLSNPKNGRAPGQDDVRIVVQGDVAFLTFSSGWVNKVLYSRFLLL